MNFAEFGIHHFSDCYIYYVYLTVNGQTIILKFAKLIVHFGRTWEI